MEQNDPGREPEPTDAELLRDFEAADVRLGNACENCMDFSEDGEPTDPEYLDAEREWKLCSERREARGREYLSGARPMPAAPAPSTDDPVCGATTRVDGKFRTCELPKGHPSDHRTTLRGIEIWWPVDEPNPPVIGSNQCEHGHLARVCVHCELIAAEARVAELEAERDRLRQIVNATAANNKTLRKRLWDVRRVRDRVAETQRARIADLERENAALVAERHEAISNYHTTLESLVGIMDEVSARFFDSDSRREWKERRHLYTSIIERKKEAPDAE